MTSTQLQPFDKTKSFKTHELPLDLHINVDKMFREGRSIKYVKNYLYMLNSVGKIKFRPAYSSIARWKRQVKPNSLDDPIDWQAQNRLNDVNSTHLPRIRQSVNWFKKSFSLTWKNTIIKPNYFKTETFRYIKWANYVLNYTGTDITLDIDLWSITKRFERRELLSKDITDLEDWIDCRPYRGGKYESQYLVGIEIKERKPIVTTDAFFSKEKHSGDPTPKGITKLLWPDSDWENISNDYLAHSLCTIGDTHYLLPSQQLIEYRQKLESMPIAQRPKPENMTIEWGNPAILKINLLDF